MIYNTHSIAAPALINSYALEGIETIGTNLNVTDSMNSFAVIHANLQDEDCQFFVNDVVLNSTTLNPGVTCFPQISSNLAVRVVNCTFIFNATDTSRESKFILKFAPSRIVDLDNLRYEFIGNMNPDHDIIWVNWGTGSNFNQLNSDSSTNNTHFGIFLSNGFTQAVRKDGMTTINGGFYNFATLFGNRGNFTVAGDGLPLFPTTCNPTTYISWGTNRTLGEIIYVVTEVLRGTSVTTNNSVNVYGSFAIELPFFSEQNYINWYVQGQTYMSTLDPTVQAVKLQRSNIFNLLGRLPCDTLLLPNTASSIGSGKTIYNGSTCIGGTAAGVTAGTSTITFDAQNNTNATFHVRSSGIFFSTANFRFTFINGANASMITWTDSFFIIVSAHTTLDCNVFARNISVSGTRNFTVIGSLFTRYSNLNSGGRLHVYPFSADVPLTGRIYGEGTDEVAVDEVVVDLIPVLVNSSCTYANGTCEYGINVTCPSPAVYAENQHCQTQSVVDQVIITPNTTNSTIVAPSFLMSQFSVILTTTIAAISALMILSISVGILKIILGCRPVPIQGGVPTQGKLVGIDGKPLYAIIVDKIH